jgi:hypothetical protein
MKGCHGASANIEIPRKNGSRVGLPACPLAPPMKRVSVSAISLETLSTSTPGSEVSQSYSYYYVQVPTSISFNPGGLSSCSVNTHQFLAQVFDYAVAKRKIRRNCRTRMEIQSILRSSRIHRCPSVFFIGCGDLSLEIPILPVERKA